MRHPIPAQVKTKLGKVPCRLNSQTTIRLFIVPPPPWSRISVPTMETGKDRAREPTSPRCSVHWPASSPARQRLSSWPREKRIGTSDDNHTRHLAASRALLRYRDRQASEGQPQDGATLDRERGSNGAPVRPADQNHRFRPCDVHPSVSGIMTHNVHPFICLSVQ